MALNWIDGVLRNSKHTGTDLLLLILLAESADRDSGTCYPGRKTLARLMRTSERTVQRTVQSLSASGEISVRQQSSPFGTNLYTISRSLLWRDESVSLQDSSELGGDKNDSPYLEGGDKNVSRGETEMSPKPLVKPSENKTVLANGFAGFYSLYPRKTKRLPAERAWAKLTHAQRQAAMDGLIKLLPDYRGREKDHIPHPATFLNEQRWDDEPITRSNGHRSKEMEFDPYLGRDTEYAR